MPNLLTEGAQFIGISPEHKGLNCGCESNGGCWAKSHPVAERGHLSRRKQHCCDQMAENLKVKCDIHADEYECADCIVTYKKKHSEYGIIIHDGGTSYALILYCPWCGTKLPESLRGE